MMATSDFPEHKDNILLLTLGPLIWAAHLLLSYATASVWCGKVVGLGGTLGPIHSVIIVYTIVGVAATALVASIGYRRHRQNDMALPHDDDTPEDRHRFLGFATFLLAALSAVAIVYAGFVIIFFRSCY
jgi:hypothetical protein